MFDSIIRALQWLIEFVGTFLYRELLKRNTVDPLNRIIGEPNEQKQHKLLREWAQTKANECTYIQLAVRNQPSSQFCLFTVSC